MVGTSTSLGRNGIHDWLLQRVSALVLGLFAICVVSYFILNPEMSYDSWKAYMQHPAMRVFSILALLSMLVHAWVGLWIVTTDYLKSTAVRLTAQIIVILTCLSLFVWGLTIMWGLN